MHLALVVADAVDLEDGVGDAVPSRARRFWRLLPGAWPSGDDGTGRGDWRWSPGVASMHPLWAEGSSSQLFHRQALVLPPIRYRLPPTLLVWLRQIDKRAAQDCYATARWSYALDTYSHVLPGMDGGIGDAMDDALG